jgi:hypothetical protein
MLTRVNECGHLLTEAHSPGAGVFLALLGHPKRSKWTVGHSVIQCTIVSLCCSQLQSYGEILRKMKDGVVKARRVSVCLIYS